jgi:hypothetical protein
MTWSIKGTYFENCPCDMVCPCTTSGMAMPADYDRCTVVLAFHIDQGDVDGVDVSGLNVAVMADSPPLMTDGNWKLGMFMDAAASKEQAEAIGGVFSGALGGPMAALGPLSARCSARRRSRWNTSTTAGDTPSRPAICSTSRSRTLCRREARLAR